MDLNGDKGQCVHKYHQNRTIQQNNSNKNSINNSPISLSEKLDFYKLHYPARKRQSPTVQPSQHPSTKTRSKSMISVLSHPDRQKHISIQIPQQQYAYINNNNIDQIHRELSPFMKPRKQMYKKNSNSMMLNVDMNEKQKIMRKYREKIIKNSISAERITFKKILAPRSDEKTSQQYNNQRSLQSLIPKLPLKSLKDIEQFSSKNLSLKQSIQHFKDQKTKINKLLLSHKQSEQIKLKYLQSKKKQINEDINKEVHEIYERYFKREYEGRYGRKELAFEEFQKNISELVRKLAGSVFV